MNKNAEYELLTKTIFQNILNHESDWITNEKDENGNYISLIKQIIITGHIILPPTNVELDFEWIKENTYLQRDDKFNFYISGEIQIIDDEGNIINNIEYYYKKLKR